MRKDNVTFVSLMTVLSLKVRTEDRLERERERENERLRFNLLSFFFL